MNLARTWIRPVYLAAYVAFLALCFDWLPPLAGAGRSSDLLFGHLQEPHHAALIASFGALLAAAAVLMAGPRKPAARALLLLLIGAALLPLGPLLSGATLPTGGTTRLILAAALLVPLLVFRKGEDPAEPRGPLALELGTLLSGTAVVWAFLILESRLVLFGTGDAAELHEHALLFAGLAGIGAFSFGLPMARGGRTLANLAALVVTVGALLGLFFLWPLASNQGLDGFLRHFGGDLSEVGRLEGGALIGGRALLVSAFAFGALVVGLNTRRSMAAFLIGVAVGRLFWPQLVESEGAAGAPQLARVAVALAALAGLPLCWNRLREAKGLARIGASTALVLLVAAAAFVPPRNTVPLSPWLRFEAEALFQVDDPLGLITVETTASGVPVLTIDRVALTPDGPQEAADAARLTAALDLMEANWEPGDPNPEVLFAGQLTLPRLEAFSAWQETSGHAARLRWSAPWEAHQAQIRPLLEASWPLSDPLPFDEARALVGSGRIDLVIVPMAFGPELSSLAGAAPPRAAAPAVRPIWRGAAANQPSVVWLSAHGPLAGARLSDSVLLGGADLDQLGLGLAHGLDDPKESGSKVLHPSGEPAEPAGALARLLQRPESRIRADRSELFARLTAAPGGPFLAAVSELLAIQTQSSPWATPLERFELSGDHLKTIADSTPKSPSGFERLVWNHLADVLVAKRMPAESLAVLPRLLERTGRWPELEYALARANLEVMETGQARVLLERLFQEQRLGLIPLIEYGNCLGQDGEWALAAEAYERALTLLPGERSIARRVAIAGARAGLPGALERIQALVAQDPEDAELAEYLQPGPLPPVPPGFDPNPLRDAREDE